MDKMTKQDLIEAEDFISKINKIVQGQMRCDKGVYCSISHDIRGLFIKRPKK